MAQRGATVYWLIAFGVAVVSTSAVLVKLSETPAVILGFYRVALALLVLVPAVFWRERDGLAALMGNAGGRRDVGAAAVAGIFLALHYATWFFSLELTSVASSTVLVTTQPIWVMLIAYVMWGQRVRPAAIAGMAIALIGVYFIGTHAASQEGGQLLGDGLAVLSAILVSGYLLIGQRVRPRVPLLIYVAIVNGSAAVVLGGLGLILGQPFTGYGGQEWLLYAALAAGPTLVGHTVFNWALQHVPASVVAVSVLGEPVGAVVLALFVLGEVPAPMQLIAGVTILLGIGLFLQAHGRAGRSGEKEVGVGGTSAG